MKNLVLALILGLGLGACGQNVPETVETPKGVDIVKECRTEVNEAGDACLPISNAALTVIEVLKRGDTLTKQEALEIGSFKGYNGGFKVEINIEELVLFSAAVPHNKIIIVLDSQKKILKAGFMKSSNGAISYFLISWLDDGEVKKTILEALDAYTAVNEVVQA